MGLWLTLLVTPNHDCKRHPVETTNKYTHFDTYVSVEIGTDKNLVFLLSCLKNKFLDHRHLLVHVLNTWKLEKFEMRVGVKENAFQ